MKTRLYLFRLLLMSTGLFVLNSCKKEDTAPEADVFFSLAVDGSTVAFTNKTTGAISYQWELGDGSTSTEASPTHAYPGKGKYVVTLYATTADGKMSEASTVLRIDKTSPVKIDDNTLSDWDALTKNVVVAGPTSGIFKKAKFDYDGQYIFIYLEMASQQSNGDILDFYLDTDNDASTGLLTSYFPGGGYDVLLEGTVLNNWLDVFYHKGSQTAFSFDPQTIADFYKVGAVVEEGGLMKYEIRVERSKIKGGASKGWKFGIVANKNDWSIEVGIIPEKATNAFFLHMDE